ncbi:MAG: STAS domain-containing protein [Chitinivibrionales bacterium]
MDEPEALKIENKSDFVWITLPDSVNMDTYKAIEEKIESRLDAACVRVVLDLSKTSNLFSSGLGLIIRVRKWVAKSNGFICLVNVSRKIRAILETVHLDKVFTIYATDVEFEISQEEIFKKRLFGDTFGFVCVSRIENGMYRINLSGHMTVDQNLSVINNFKPNYKIMYHVFDLTGLDVIDSSGAHIFMKLLMNIDQHDGKSVAYGANDTVASLAEILGINEYLHFCEDERSALEGIQKL